MPTYNPPRYLLDWQRMLDPSNFNKTKGAAYHTAPSVVFPGSPDYPDDVPDDSVTIMFQIDGDMWIGDPQRIVVRDITFMEKPPKRGCKNGPVIGLSTTTALCAIPVSANYYWAVNVLSKHETVVVTFRPDTTIDMKTGKIKHITCVATFMPNDGEPRP